MIEMDPVSEAALIRSVKPTPEGFTEIILRGGNSITLERRGKSLHISRPNLDTPYRRPEIRLLRKGPTRCGRRLCPLLIKEEGWLRPVF